ncbi:MULTISPECIES: hypothetical protein [Yersinia pseudotuberculosis complex]|uniref:Membrane protein n=2 Tax=Yersinia pseudotuberculosis complex TaxID=1649845 RepID=A0A0T9QCB1_9GAMM|nr:MULTISPECIES: hypothetical protein [Yersinia pseudotuberculosis complex]ABS46978.1 hypothetical protein YpsIP31758_4112 [Yersinia pseudotuberculosis IP 31758]MCE4112630.1 hypothetical protein [Yersinia pseudotuberculosis]MCF1163470.1 hypothetical protein [Yersinia pseudotuberculosis]RYC27155.1 hypothetical protein EU971_06600 [Yersinia pseudotuberculosis]UFA59677.1 Putative membrane protein [Yersinia pseudotuberculosis]
MTELEMEKKLLNNGFTAKNIAHMRKIISRDDKKKETYSSLLIELKKRFFAGCLICAILFTPLIFMMFNDYTSDEIFSYLVALIFGLYMTYYITPLNLAWKSYRYLSNKEE